jgi:hypothetical protein
MTLEILVPLAMLECPWCIALFLALRNTLETLKTFRPKTWYIYDALWYPWVPHFIKEDLVKAVYFSFATTVYSYKEWLWPIFSHSSFLFWHSLVPASFPGLNGCLLTDWWILCKSYLNMLHVILLSNKWIVIVIELSLSLTNPTISKPVKMQYYGHKFLIHTRLYYWQFNNIPVG